MASNGSDGCRIDNGGRRPVIGLTAYTEQARYLAWDVEASLLPTAYVDAVIRSGGVPVLLPPVQGGVDAVAAALDGLVLSGGGDVNAGPRRARELPAPPGAEPGGGRSRRRRWAEDGTVEAVEMPGCSFVLGGQWHPEQDAADDWLFAALVAAASCAGG